MNGYNLINELKLLAQDEKLSPEDGQRVILASLVDILQNQHIVGKEIKEIRASQAETSEELEKLKTDTKAWIEKLEKAITQTRRELRDKIKTLTSTPDSNNPLIVIGGWLSKLYVKSPWKAYVAIVVFLFCMNIVTYTIIQAGLVGDVLRIFVPLGLPVEWVEPLLR